MSITKRQSCTEPVSLRTTKRVAVAIASGLALLSTSPALAKSAPAKAAATEPATAPAPDAPPAAATTAPADAPPQRFDIDEFRVDGADKLPQIEVEEAIYPFLGPNRNAADVEKARTALEKAYHDRGYQTVNVAVPPQNAATRVIVLKVAEIKVGRLRVTNAKFYDLDKIRTKASSLKEGELPDFNEVTKDMVALNQQPDRRVTPTLRAGVTPGTVDVDLNVEDKLPLHGSLEANNRRSPNTTPTRINATVKYDNLWQLGHSFSLSYQVAPQRRKDAEVFQGSYLARLTDWTSLLVYGVDSSSDVATVGGMNVVGPGRTIGTRVVLTLPSLDGFFHTLSGGIDYKHFDQTVKLGSDAFNTPITYYPLSISYGATLQNDGALTQFNLGITSNLRGLGSSWAEWDAKRGYSSASFTHLNADLSHTQDLPQSFQLFAKVKGQIADGPLISSEQFGIGGADVVRGYFESEAIGDNGIAGTLELRSPDLATLLNATGGAADGPAGTTILNEWRVFGFADAGITTIYKPLSEQKSHFEMASFGVGTRFKLFDHFSGSVALALPVVRDTETRNSDPRVLFGLTGEF